MDREQRDRELDAVLVGGREQCGIVIVDYDSGWPARFETERARVRQALGVQALRIEHIGSTAVPGLAAKPIIDLLVTVEDPEDESRTVPRLTAAGYELRVREPGHRMFHTPDRDVHVHIWGEDDPEVARCLRFRDRLRDSPEDRQTYEQRMRELARRDSTDMNHYADAKGPMIEAILARARD
ncbi:MAG: GrpB family protein [Solirubrobacteraceae bacterium]